MGKKYSKPKGSRGVGGSLGSGNQAELASILYSQPELNPDLERAAANREMIKNIQEREEIEKKQSKIKRESSRINKFK